MLNCDKAILVAYIDVYNVNKAKGVEMVSQFKYYLEKSFYNEKEINDDSLVILTIPSNKTEIQLLNARYPDYEKLENFAKHKMIEFMEEQEKISKTK